MAIPYYDEAIAKRLQDWINDPKIHVYRPEEVSWMLQQKADEANDNPISLPFIALSRQTEISLENPNRRPMSYDGLSLRLLDKDGREVHLKSGYKLNAIPMRLNYQLDIYTKGMIEATEYIREFVFKLVNYPTIAITIPYNGVDLTHKSTIQVNPQIEDNSDIPQRLYPGQFTRFTIRFSVDDAYLFSVVAKDHLSIGSISFEVVTNNPDGSSDIEVETVEPSI